jgi:hypothetical protein
MAARRRVVVEAPRIKRNAPQVEEIRIVVLDDDEPDTSFLDQDEFKDRRAEYDRGDFKFVGVRADAEVTIEGVVQTITSGGIWGVESDAEGQIRMLAEDEYADLRKILTSIGVSTSQLPLKMERSWIKWRA